ncbi:hypothetical protein [Mesorhizobium sp. M0037]|uniref:hypothetical protein n=1 Tax=unclassified Mesorhizobium TaxID=325217 RepID=UPI00333A673C
MRIADVQARIDAQERRLEKQFVPMGDDEGAPDDFSVELHDGTLLVPTLSKHFIRMIAIPCGKFLKAGVEPDTIELQREVLATGERYLVEIDGESLEVGAVRVREDVAVLVDAPEAPIVVQRVFEAQAQSITVHEVPYAAGAENTGAAPVVPHTPADVLEAELAVVEAHMAKLRGGPREATAQFRGPRSWANETSKSWRGL